MSPYVRRLLDDALFNPVNDFVVCQGKRIRRSILQLSYEMSGGVGQVASAISEAIESLHSGSLIIDDIQDDSHSRRGQAPMHHRVGVPLAINAGNWMYFQALHCLSEAPLPAAQSARLVKAMIAAARQCHEGQAIDLHARIDRTPAEYWHETTLAISSLKTGTLVALAVDLGCIAADPKSTLSCALPRFGRQVGIALQMRNDLDELAKIALDQRDPARTDFIRDDDLRNARLTWPWVWALDLAGEARCSALVQRAIRSRQDRLGVATELFEISSSHGDRIIGSIVRDQLRLLGEHVIDRRRLDLLSEVLEPIEHTTQVGINVDRTLTHSSPGTVNQ